MFEKLRKPKRTKNIAYYVIFGLICLVFVFIGVPVSQLSNMGGAAIIVNNQVISWSEYRRYLSILEQEGSQAGLDANLEAKRQEQLRQKTVEALLGNELVVQEAKNTGFAVSKKEVRDKILEFPFLQEDGRFTHSKYRAFLSARRFSAGYFEGLIKKETKTSRFHNTFNFVSWSPLLEKQKKQDLSFFQASISYIQFSSLEMDPEEFNSIKTFVQEGDPKILAQIIKDKKWKWEQTRVFDLSRVSLPGLESHKILFDEALNFMPDTGIIKKVINTRDKSFILRVDSFSVQKKKNQEESSLDFFTNKMMARMAFSSWIRSARSSAKIKLNPKLNYIAVSTPTN